jgi:predicted neutral ceramidase superfamily lipid hydrolase
MKYESEFRIKEKEFRPRKDFKHQQVVNELANIVKRADLEIEEVEDANYKALVMLDRTEKKLKEANDQIRIYQTTIAVLGLCVLLLFIGILN